MKKERKKKPLMNEIKKLNKLGIFMFMDRKTEYYQNVISSQIDLLIQ